MTLKNYVGIPDIAKHTSAYKLTLPFQGIYSREIKTTLFKKTHIGPILNGKKKNWKQLKSPSTEEKINYGIFIQ